MTPHNNVIAIASGKGGVGKTWLAVTLSYLCARHGRNVLLFDGDVGLANVDVQLGLMPEQDLQTVCRGRANLRDIVLSHETDSGSHIDIIAGRSGSTTLSLLKEGTLKAVQQELLSLSTEYDTVFMDLGAGIEHYVQSMAAIAARCIVVITDDPTSLTDAYAFIKLWVTKLHNTHVEIIVNQAQTHKEGERTFEGLCRACENFLKITPSLLGIVRRDNKVRDAIRAQRCIVDKAPSSLATTDVAAIAVKLFQR